MTAGCSLEENPGGSWALAGGVWRRPIAPLKGFNDPLASD